MSESPYRRIRNLVVESLYEAETSTHDAVIVFERHLEAEAATRPGLMKDEPRDYGRRALQGVLAGKRELDEHIAKAAARFPLDTMAVVDRNILRLAIWELVTDTSAPTGAVINEAVELARRYGGEKSPAFVNGVLRTVAERVRGSETKDPGIREQLTPNTKDQEKP